jgi:hypothetical protein
MQRLQEQRQSSSGDDDHTGVALIMGAVLFFAVVGGGFTQGPGLVFFMLVIGVILFVGASAMTSSNIETTHSERIVEFHASLELESSTYYWYSAGQRGRSNHGGSLDDLCRLRVSRSGGEDARTHFNLGLLTPEGSPKPLFEGLEWDEINHVLDHISVYLSLQGLRDVAVAFSARIDETIIDPEGRLLQPRDVEYEVFQA